MSGDLNDMVTWFGEYYVPIRLLLSDLSHLTIILGDSEVWCSELVYLSRGTGLGQLLYNGRSVLSVQDSSKEWTRVIDCSCPDYPLEESRNRPDCS